MSKKKWTAQLHIALTCPANSIKEGWKRRLDLVLDLTLDFVPVPGLYLWLTPDLPDNETHLWSPLLKAACGPKGAEGQGLNTDFWQVEKVFFHVKEKRFCLYSYPMLETVEQFHAVRDLLVGYYGFHIDRHLPP